MIDRNFELGMFLGAGLRVALQGLHAHPFRLPPRENGATADGKNGAPGKDKSVEP